MTELTEGSYAREGTVETGIVKLRTVELKVGEVNVVELLVGKGLAEREQNPGETNQVQNTVKESKVLEVNVNEEVVTLKHDVNDFYDLIDLVGKEVVDGTAIPDSSDEEEMTAMTDLRVWSPMVEGRETEVEEGRKLREVYEGEDVSGSKVEVEVLSVESPACILLREISVAWPHFYTLLQQQRCRMGEISDEELSLGQMVLVRLNNLVYRGKLVRLEGDKLEVWLVDYGRLVDVSRSEVGPPGMDEISAAPPFCFAIGIAEVEAAGTSDPKVWTEESILELKSILKEKELMMETVQSDGDAVLWIVERTCNDPFGAETCTWAKVGDLLKQKGLAFEKGTAQLAEQKFLDQHLGCGEEVEHTGPDFAEDDPSSKTGEFAPDSETSDSVSLSLPEIVEKKPRHPRRCFSGSLVKVDKSGLVWVKEAEQEQEIAVRLSGVRRVAGKDPSGLLQHLEAHARCYVILSGATQEEGLGPLVGDIFYGGSGGGEREVNLALVGLEKGLLEVVKTWEEWAEEVIGDDVGECESSRGRSPQLPYPLPLGLGLWLPVNLHVIHPQLPLVFLSVRYVRPDTSFAQCREELRKSLFTTMHQVAMMEKSFSRAREVFQKQAELGGEEEQTRHPVGDHILALYENQEWCRGVVTKKTETSATVDLSDFGHPLIVGAGQMRRLSRDMWQGPKQGRVVFYKQPPTEEWQEVMPVRFYVKLARPIYPMRELIIF